MGCYRLPHKFDGVIFRKTILAVCLGLTVILRLSFVLSNMVHKQTDSKVIGDKSLLVLVVMMSATGLGLGIIDEQYRHVVLQISGMVILNGWPLVVILSNQNVKSFVTRRYQTEIDWILARQPNFLHALNS